MTHKGKGGGISRKEGRGDGMGSLGEGVGEVGGACTRVHKTMEGERRYRGSEVEVFGNFGGGGGKGMGGCMNGGRDRREGR